MAKFTETEKAYMAGVIDSDGCISLSPAYKNKRGLGHRLILTVTNNSLSLISWIAEKWRANFYAYKSNNALNPLCRHRHYTCQVTGKKAAIIIKEILPYFIGKKRQAEAAIDYGKTVGKQGQKISESIRNKRIKLDKKIKTFNNNPK